MANKWSIAGVPSIAFLFAGGMHQALHIAPVAAELAKGGMANVTAFVRTPREAAELSELLAALGAPDIRVTVMRLPSWIEAIGRLKSGWRAMKLPRLLAFREALNRFDAIVTAERTATILKRLPGSKPFMIHIPHGAGDRARSYDARIRFFDHVIVAGPKDRRRMIAEGLVDAAHCDVAGYIKLAAINRLAGKQPMRLFNNGRPTVVYNPHFDATLSSWDKFGARLIDAIASDDRFNLIVAPHVRLFEGVDSTAWEARSIPGRIIVDPGSPRSQDMSYTRAADIYVGDVSSQIYEFLSRPRPCVFIDAHGVNWQGNPDYAMWRLGAVVTNLDDLMIELGRARRRHKEFADLQRAAVADAFGDSGDDAPAVAAHQIVAAIASR